MICHDTTVAPLFVEQKKIAPLSALAANFTTIANFAITKIASITEKARLIGRITTMMTTALLELFHGVLFIGFGILLPLALFVVIILYAIHKFG